MKALSGRLTRVSRQDERGSVMFRYELSTFLREVLDAVSLSEHGIRIDASGEPDLREVVRLARRLGEAPDDVRQALLGLRAGHCLLEVTVEFGGIEPLAWWTVHPQCVT